MSPDPPSHEQWRVIAVDGERLVPEWTRWRHLCGQTVTVHGGTQTATNDTHALHLLTCPAVKAQRTKGTP